MAVLSFTVDLNYKLGRGIIGNIENVESTGDSFKSSPSQAFLKLFARLA